jgi:hypothetical protein
MDDELFSATVLSKLPLADAVWRILHFTLSDSWLNDLWNRERGRCYQKVLQFSTLARLVTEALAQHGGSGRQAFERGHESDTLPVAISSAFEKLGNVPLSVSEQMLREGTQRLAELLPVQPAVDPFPLPPCWEGHEVFGIDGKAIKHVKRLLKPLRGLQAGILGARSSVALDLRTGLALGMSGDLDGEAGEGGLTEGLLSDMAAEAGGKHWVVVLDRLYCNLGFPKLILAAGGHFLIRYCSNTHFVADPPRPAQQSRDARGQRIVQEWGRLGKSAGSGALYVRRITLYLAGGRQISVITDLLDEVAYPAEDLLTTYKKRWGIEKVFHQITDVFSLKNLIGTSPQAVLFQLSLCLLMYNTLQVVRTHLASHQECEAEEISNEKLFYDLKRELVSLDRLVEKESLLRLLGAAPTSEQLRHDLQRNLCGVWSDRWWKAPSSRGGGHQHSKTRVLGNHTSTYRELQKVKA